MFDISHMGRLLIEDPEKKLQYFTTNNLDKLSVGKVQYNLLPNEKGGIKDDVTVYMLSEIEFFLCVNAANRQKVINWLSPHLKLRDLSGELVQIALQGPKSEEIISKFYPVSDLKYYRFKVFDKTIISRTGYTGEDGFEIYVSPEEGKELFLELVKLAKPCGLGARDVLRIEAGLPLYGNELSEEITPIEVNLEKFVDFSKEFIGKEAMLKKKVKKKLFGLELTEKGIPRKGYRVFKGDREIGWISSGTYSPTLNKGIALCFVDIEERKEGNEVEIEVRGRRVRGVLRKYPFVRTPAGRYQK
ncbi:aminomethyltransferase (glycine cleavage system T protein) [Aquifex aeolicus VF5]|nr:aminomethyltransferase (glycine cleavage system T protein) [Aquifex aeolicus VF5]